MAALPADTPIMERSSRRVIDPDRSPMHVTPVVFIRARHALCL
jgi:hypothetical protein